MTDQAQYGIAITASDATAKGAKSAEKRLSLIPKRVGEVSKKSLADSDKALAKHGGGILRTFASVEKSAAKVFGGKSISSGIVGRMGAVKESASALGTGLGEAATAGTLLEGALTAVGVVAGATVGILAAVGYAGYKLADSWAKGAASIGRTSDVIGVATKQLQEFQAAGERAGVDKGASTGAIAGIAQTLNDARYGRNPEALALMMRLGVKFRTGKDGQLDTSAMTLDLADAIARQKNAQTRRMIAGKFGISDAALPMFLAGSGQLKADMADADKTAAILSPDDIARGKRIVRKGAIVGQMKDRALMGVGMAAAGGEEAALNGIISGGRSILEGGGSFVKAVRDDFAPAARAIGRAAEKMERAAGSLVSSMGAPPALSAGMANMARYVMHFFEGQGWNRGQAAGIAANLLTESHFNPKARGDRGLAFGIGQWHPDRQADFRRVFGHDIRSGSFQEQLAFVQWELTHGRRSYAGSALRTAGDAATAGSIVSRKYESPADVYGQANSRAALAERLAALPEVPVKVEIDMRGAPHGTKAKVTAGRSKHPAVSHAFASAH